MMMRRNTIAFLLVMLVCMTGELWVAPHLFSSVQAQDVQRLVLRDSSGRELFSRPAPDGSEFAIRYRHSVALSPVEDWFSVSGGCIYLEKTVYQDFGAGLPHQPGPGQRTADRAGRGKRQGLSMEKVGDLQNKAGTPVPSESAGTCNRNRACAGGTGKVSDGKRIQGEGVI